MFRFLKKSARGDSEFNKFIYSVFGVRPKKLDIYKQAFVHKSFIREEKDAHFKSNERLEFLGDAVLDNVVAEFLYHEFPKKDEGFLTQLKARIVNGAHLNDLGVKMGFEKHTRFQQFGTSTPRALYGDVMEALIGALYLDLGYVKTRKVILDRILKKHVDLKSLATNDDDYKSQLLIWAQRKKKRVQFSLVREKNTGKGKLFEIAVMIDGKEISRAEAANKRDAEKAASGKALKKLRSPHKKESGN